MTGGVQSDRAPPATKAGSVAGDDVIEITGLTKDYGPKRPSTTSTFTVHPGHGPVTVSCAERLREVDDDAPHPRPGRAHRELQRSTGSATGAFGRRSSEVGRSSRPPIRTGRSAYRRLLGAGATARDPEEPRRRARRPRRPARRRGERAVLARHGAAPRHRRGAARRSGDVFDEPVNGLDPEGHALDRILKGLAAEENGLRLSHPHERDGGHRRPPDRDRPGPADGRGHRH